MVKGVGVQVFVVQDEAAALTWSGYTGLEEKRAGKKERVTALEGVLDVATCFARSSVALCLVVAFSFPPGNPEKKPASSPLSRLCGARGGVTREKDMKGRESNLRGTDLSAANGVKCSRVAGLASQFNRHVDSKFCAPERGSSTHAGIRSQMLEGALIGACLITGN